MKVLTLFIAKSYVFLWYVQCCSCTRRSKTKILTTRAPPSWIEFYVVTSQRQTRHNVMIMNYIYIAHFSYGYVHILNMTCDCWFPCSCVYWSLVKARKIVWESHVIDSSCITQSAALWVWRCDVTTSNSIQDGGALVVNILVFDLRVQLQHCTYQRKTLHFALIKVSTFICKREILGWSVKRVKVDGCTQCVPIFKLCSLLHLHSVLFRPHPVTLCRIAFHTGLPQPNPIPKHR